MSTTEAQPVLEVVKLTKHFGSFTALKDATFSVNKGEIRGFLGPNGAGKTTTIRIIMDFARPSDGTVQVFGLDARNDSVAIKRQIGFLSGDFELYDNLTGTQYLNYIAHLRHLKDMKRRGELIDQLEAVTDRKLGTLSRGNKQKIGLIAALMHDPDLLILDEPTTGLDPLMQQRFYEVIRDHASRGKTVFMSSHILSEVQAVCDSITFMKAGTVLETVGVNELLERSLKHVTLKLETGAKPIVPPTELQVSHLTLQGQAMSFNVPSSGRPLLEWLATLPIEEVGISEDNLDSVFMGLYERDEEIV